MGVLTKCVKVFKNFVAHISARITLYILFLKNNLSCKNIYTLQWFFFLMEHLPSGAFPNTIQTYNLEILTWVCFKTQGVTSISFDVSTLPPDIITLLILNTVWYQKAFPHCMSVLHNISCKCTQEESITPFKSCSTIKCSTLREVWVGHEHYFCLQELWNFRYQKSFPLPPQIFV